MPSNAPVDGDNQFFIDVSGYPTRYTQKALCISSMTGHAGRTYTRKYDNGTYGNWISNVTTSDFGILTVEVVSVANEATAIPGSPSTGNWIPVVVNHVQTTDCLENVYYHGSTWYIYSNKTQNVRVRFFKYPI